ncbi:superoxide dismutase [Cu-Zn]-like isoform X2 [Mya arenaria]|uniref:superoxide dismutase [Cu-Zn]-like isoform X2 n=1 Tax=Mya arenaria TaxID=6604 RepID=UPI0022E78310|nr:superoxide dismutase [Cu-Zn]-like isoform X2 [Mya arenaria]
MFQWISTLTLLMLFICHWIDCQKTVNLNDICKDKYAVCHINPPADGSSNITGKIMLHQKARGNCKYDFLNVQVNIYNVPENDGTDMHGFHVHEYGDMERGCSSMGGHYNPNNAPHGGPWNPPRSRHVGDFGNVKQLSLTGNIETRIVDYLAKLNGPDSIMGRGMVLHAKKDDLGRGEGPDSRKTGNAGHRLACCIITACEPFTLDGYNLYR